MPASTTVMRSFRILFRARLPRFFILVIHLLACPGLKHCQACLYGVLPYLKNRSLRLPRIIGISDGEVVPPLFREQRRECRNSELCDTSDSQPYAPSGVLSVLQRRYRGIGDLPVAILPFENHNGIAR